MDADGRRAPWGDGLAGVGRAGTGSNGWIAATAIGAETPGFRISRVAVTEQDRSTTHRQPRGGSRSLPSVEVTLVGKLYSSQQRDCHELSK
jgi:hypothetical protein